MTSRHRCRFFLRLLQLTGQAIAAVLLPPPALANDQEVPYCYGLEDYLGYPVHPLITYGGLEICAQDGFMHSCTPIGWQRTATSCGTQIGIPRTWYVDDRPGGPGNGSSKDPFRSVQDALDAARDGDRVYIRNGSYEADPRPYTDPTCGNCNPYQQPLDATVGFYAVGKTLVVEGQSRNRVVLNTGAQYGFVFEHAGTSVIKNLTLTGGKRGKDDRTTDAALLARYSQLLARGLKIEGNLGVVGGGGPARDVGIAGIAGREGASLTVESCLIRNNSWDGIALYRGDARRNRAAAEIYDNVITEGPGTRAAGIGLTWDSAAIARRNDISFYRKGIVAVGDSISELTNNVIRDIKAWALGIEMSPRVTAINNVVTRSGFGVFAFVGEPVLNLRNNIFYANTAGVAWRPGHRPPLSYNDVYGSEVVDLGECADTTDPEDCIPQDFGPGDVGNISLDPRFNGAAANHFTLACDSPARDAGDPAPAYDDLDGTRNDMGIYGGPYSGQPPACGPLESLIVAADGTAVSTAGSYSSSQVFRIEVSGTYVWGGCDPIACPGGGACGYLRYGDAEHLTDDCWASDYPLFGSTDISVYVDGGNVDWGAYDSSHVYSITRVGNDGPFSFHIHDCAPCYGDNSGSLTVRIYPDE